MRWPRSIVTATLLLFAAGCTADPADAAGGSGDTGDSADASSTAGGGSGAEGGATSSASGAGSDTDPAADATTAADSAADTGADTDGGTDSETGADSDTDTDTGGPDEPYEFGPGVFVRGADGVNSNPGTMDEPLRTIQAGVQAAMERGLSAVYIAEGTYEANHEDGEAIELTEAIDLVGGFSAEAWPNRDPDQYVTRVVDLSGGVGLTSRDFPHYPLRIDLAEGSPIIEGLTLEAAPAGFAAAVSITAGTPRLVDTVLLGNPEAEESFAASIRYADPTIEDSIIDAVGAQSVAFTVYCQSGDPTLLRNTVESGDGDDDSAVLYQGCGGVMASNLIRSADHQFGTSQAIGLAAFSGPVLVGNTIVKAGTSNGTASFIRFFHPTTLEAIGNNFVHTGDGQSWCLYAAPQPSDDVVDDPVSLTHNNFACTALYRRWQFEAQTIGTITELHALVDGASDNVQVDAGVVDPVTDLHLRDDGTAPCEVVVGGLDLSALAGSIDLDGVGRSDPWSIGAYELDGACL